MKRQVRIHNRIHSKEERLREFTEFLIEVSKQNRRTDMIFMLMEELRPKIEEKVRLAFKRYKLANLEESLDWEGFVKFLRRHL
jgi:hypothetical protein